MNGHHGSALSLQFVKRTWSEQVHRKKASAMLWRELISTGGREPRPLLKLGDYDPFSRALTGLARAGDPATGRAGFILGYLRPGPSWIKKPTRPRTRVQTRQHVWRKGSFCFGGSFPPA